MYIILKNPFVLWGFLHVCLWCVVGVIGAEDNGAEGGGHSTSNVSSSGVLSVLFWTLYKWTTTIIVLVFLWERRNSLLGFFMGHRQTNHTPLQRRGVGGEEDGRHADREPSPQEQHTTRLVNELQQKVEDLHAEGQARERAVKQRDEDILHLKESIRLHERKQEQLKDTIAAHERMAVTYSAQQRAKAERDKEINDMQARLTDRDKEIHDLNGKMQNVLGENKRLSDAAQQDKTTHSEFSLHIQQLTEERDNIKAQLKEQVVQLKRQDSFVKEKTVLVEALERDVSVLKEKLLAAQKVQKEWEEERVTLLSSANNNNNNNSNNNNSSSSNNNNNETHDLSLGFGSVSDLSSLASNLELDEMEDLNDLDELDSTAGLPAAGIATRTSRTISQASAMPLASTKVNGTLFTTTCISPKNSPHSPTSNDAPRIDNLDDFSRSLTSALNGTGQKAESRTVRASSPLATSSSNQPSYTTLPRGKGKSSTGRTSLFSLFPGAESIQEESTSPPPVRATVKAVSASTANQDGKALIVAYSCKADINKLGLKRAKKKSFAFGKKGSDQPQMEDFHFCAYPFNGDDSQALFGVFDGHAGTEAATEAITLVPKEFAKQLGLSDNIEKVLKGTIAAVDKAMSDCEYVGSTATIVYVWRKGGSRFLQAANLGDSTAFLCRGSEAVQLTVDHKASDPKEKQRMRDAGIEIGESQSRINGLTVSRSLGNHFVKEQNIGMIAEPYIYRCIEIEPTDKFLVIASDGLWDIVSGQHAIDIALGLGDKFTAEEAAKTLLQTALQSPKCNDNVTVIVAQLN